jgi:3-methyladenine DNA glycosylase/8-oxoguanine DNA glycosylase
MAVTQHTERHGEGRVRGYRRLVLPDASVTVEMSGPYWLPGTRGVIGAKSQVGPFVVEGGTVWRALDTPDGPATLRLSPAGPMVRAEAWGPGAGRVIAQAPELAGANDVGAAAIVARHPVLAEVIRRRPRMRMVRTGTVWPHLPPTILAQKVQTDAASRSWTGIMRRWGRRPPGPAPARLRLVPEPAAMAEIGYHELHPYGVERRRAEIIRRAARRAGRFERTTGDPPAEARRVIESVPGIGPWTSAIVTQQSHGDPDAVLVGDYHVPNVVAWALAGEPRATDERMLELLEPYAGQRARVQLLLKTAGLTPPKYGPRLDLVDITRR